RPVQPINHFEIAVKIDALDRWYPTLEDFQAADRPVLAALPRRLQPRGPGRADAADEDEASILCRRNLDREFAFAKLFVFCHLSHPEEPDKSSALWPRRNCGASTQQPLPGEHHNLAADHARED